MQEPETEYHQKAKSDARPQQDLLKQYIEKARKITKPCVVDKATYEEIVWRHNNEIELRE